MDPKLEAKRRRLFFTWMKLINVPSEDLERWRGSVPGRLASETARRSGAAVLRMRAKLGPASLSGPEQASAALHNWSAADWRWAQRQVNFVRRSKAGAGQNFEATGRPTPRLRALLSWGHRPNPRSLDLAIQGWGKFADEVNA